MNKRNVLKCLLAAPLLPLLAALSPAANAADPAGATYEITVERTWSMATHPLEWPGDKSHFSPGIGAVHDGNYTLFAAQGTATPGLELLSQRGRTSPFDTELDAARGKGHVGGIFQFDAIGAVGGKAGARVTASDRYPLLSLAAMVAPSPDWFTGISALPLKRDGRWIDGETITLYAWDSGTNNATTYTAPKIEATPFQPIDLNDAPMFVRDGHRIPVAVLTLRRVATP